MRIRRLVGRATLLRTALVAVVLLLIQSCSPTPPVRIGFIAALSGRLSQLGVASREALQIAVSLQNERGGINGRRIELSVVDDQSIPEKGIEEINNLADVGVAAIIGPLTSNMLPAIESLEGRNILIFSPTVSTASLDGRDDHFIRAISSTSHQGRILSVLMDRDGMDTVSIVYDTSNVEYTGDVLDSFLEFYGGAGTVNGIYPYDSSDDHDFVELAEKIVGDSSQALLMITSGIDAAALAQQLWKRDHAVALYGARWAKTDDILEYGGRAVEGMKLVSDYFVCESDAAAEFRRRFRQRLGYDPGFSSIYTYEAAQILFSAMERASSFSADELKSEILNRVHPGYCYDIFLDRYGDIQRQDAYTVIEEGVFRARPLE